jgi:uncharacterized OsmC-like protein
MTSSDSIRDAVSKASAYLSDHPNEARYRDAYARARLRDGLAVDVDGPGGERLRTDMPRGIGGAAKSPSPGWLFRAAVASCVAALIGIRAATQGVALGDVEVFVDTESDDRGILGLDPAIHAGVLSVKIVVSASAPGVARGDLDALIRWAVDHCPVSDTVVRAVPLELEIR